MKQSSGKPHATKMFSKATALRTDCESQQNGMKSGLTCTYTDARHMPLDMDC